MGISLTAAFGGRRRFADCPSSVPVVIDVDGVRSDGEGLTDETSAVLRFAVALNVEAGVALFVWMTALD